jgi:hypothetical protein
MYSSGTSFSNLHSAVVGAKEPMPSASKKLTSTPICDLDQPTAGACPGNAGARMAPATKARRRSPRPNRK